MRMKARKELTHIHDIVIHCNCWFSSALCPSLSVKKRKLNPWSSILYFLSRTQQWRPTCWMRTQLRDGRAESASGRTSMRKLWPTSTALMFRRFSSFTALPAPPSQRQSVAPQHLQQTQRCKHQWTLWTPLTALSWPVTTQCWGHRCRSAAVTLNQSQPALWGQEFCFHHHHHKSENTQNAAANMMGFKQPVRVKHWK